MILPNPSNFSWEESPMRSLYIPISVSSVYLFIIIMHKVVFGKNPPGLGDLQGLQAIHNMILCLGSFVMFCGCLYEVFQRSLTEGTATWLLCESPKTEAVGALWFWSYIYYLSKFYELFDTILQLLRGKLPPNYFLHVYHHASVLLMCWCWLEYAATMQYIALLFNTAVHVVMYYYFFMRSIGKPPAWKQYVTLFQIVQFMTSLLCFGFTLYLIYGLHYECKSMNILLGQLVFNITLLYGFVGVLFKGGKQRAEKRR